MVERNVEEEQKFCEDGGRIRKVQAVPKVGRILLSWEMDDQNVDHLEIMGRYPKDEGFWLYGRYPAITRAVELYAEPLAPMDIRI